jgi:hypothetical protein
MAAIFAIAALFAALLAMSSGSPSYPSVPVVIVALCKALQDRGEMAPLPVSQAADRDLAVRAIKLLALPGSWPPPNSDPSTKRQWFSTVVELARRVRSGEIVCVKDGSDSGGGGGGGGNVGTVCEHLTKLLLEQMAAQGQTLTEAQKAQAIGSCISNAAADPAAFAAAAPCILKATTFAQAMACFKTPDEWSDPIEMPTMPGALLCQALAERGEAAPLPSSAAADRDLAVRAIKLLGLPGSWPPPASDPLARAWFDSVVQLAARVRSGELVCQGESNAPNLAAIQQAICGILLPLADPDDHYLEKGSMPADAAVDVASAAIESLGANPASIPAAVLATATTYALDVIEGRIACGITDAIITPGSVRAPGKWLQLKYGDNLLQIAGDTYGVGAGNRRTELAREINQHPYNLGLHVATTQEWNKTNIGPTMISFFNRWRPSPKTVMQRFEAGNAMAVIYLPEL